MIGFFALNISSERRVDLDASLLAWQANRAAREQLVPSSVRAQLARREGLEKKFADAKVVVITSHASNTNA